MAPATIAASAAALRASSISASRDLAMVAKPVTRPINGVAATVDGDTLTVTVTFAPKSSHFYTPFTIECDKVKLNKD